MGFTGRVITTKQDNYNTPKNGWEDIMQYVEDKNKKIWLPFYNDGKCKEILNEMGYTNIIHEDKDFFTYEVENAIVIDNPPYSCKEKVIEKLFKMKIPFSLLLPLETIERKYFKKYINGFQLVIPNVRYEYTDKKGGVPFKSCWFCWNMQNYLPNKELIFL